MNAGVYCIVNTSNGKVYIGSSVNINHRIKQHFHMLKKGCHHSQKLQRAWDKYGGFAFKHKVILHCEPKKDQLMMYESICFSAFNPTTNGYNICSDPRSRLGVPHPPEIRAKISAANIGKKPTLGMKLNSGPKLSVALKGRSKPPRTKEHSQKINTPERNAKISEALKGVKRGPLSPESLARRRESLIKNPGWQIGLKKMAATKLGVKYAPGRKTNAGRVCSQETKVKMSEGMKASWALRRANKGHLQ